MELDRTLVHAALIDHVRYWVADDGPDYHAAQKEWNSGTGNLSANLIFDRIGRRYAVNRGFQADDYKRKAFASLLTSEMQTWPTTSLSERARKSIRIAQEAAKSIGGNEAISRYTACSAVSKFAWFVEPKDWTLFDSYACRALGVKGNKSTDLMLEFYSCLEKLAIIETWGALRKKFGSCGFGFLWPERFTDKILWLVGSPPGADLKRDYAGLTFGDDVARQLEHLTNEISGVMTTSGLWEYLESRRK